MTATGPETGVATELQVENLADEELFVRVERRAD